MILSRYSAETLQGIILGFHCADRALVTSFRSGRTVDATDHSNRPITSRLSSRECVFLKANASVFLDINEADLLSKASGEVS